MDERPLTLPISPLGLLILALLSERPMHPYEMFQLASERHEDRLVKLKPGTMYHAVDRLAGHGLIEVAEVLREGNRPERTVYVNTPAGSSALVASLELILARNPQEYPELYLAVAEAHSLPRARVIALFSRRLDRMREELADTDTASRGLGAEGKAEMFYLDYGCRIATLRAQIDWLSDLLVRLKDNTIAWLDDEHPGVMDNTADVHRAPVTELTGAHVIEEEDQQ